MSIRRTSLLVVSLVLVVASVAAWVIGAKVQSPQQAAARAAAPEPSAVTAPIERRVLASTVITRADVLPAQSVTIVGPAPDGQAEASGIVTGVFVERGDAVSDGDRMIEVAGRPVFVFAGTTPAYRTLRPGMVGTDITQLQVGLAAVGCDPGGTGWYDDATKQCVDQMYSDAGYIATRSSPTEAADLTAATAIVADAEDALAIAQLNLSIASQHAGTSTAMEQLAVDQQRRAVERAHQALSELQAESGPVVPFGEIVFVPEIPARVAAVNAVVGQPPADGSSNTGLLVVATPKLQANIAISQADRGLVHEDAPVDLLYEATGETIEGSVRSIGSELQPSNPSSVPSYAAIVDADFPETWSGLNVRATFISATTATEVLVVPLAAVSSGADGTTRVQIERADGTIETVPVTTGLSADGFVEVTADKTGVIDEGDRVVVG